MRFVVTVFWSQPTFYERRARPPRPARRVAPVRPVRAPQAPPPTPRPLPKAA